MKTKTGFLVVMGMVMGLAGSTAQANCGEFVESLKAEIERFSVAPGRPLEQVELQRRLDQYPHTVEEYVEAEGMKHVDENTVVYRFADNARGFGGQGSTYWQTYSPHSAYSGRYLFKTTLGELIRNGALVRVDHMAPEAAEGTISIVAFNQMAWARVPGERVESVGFGVIGSTPVYRLPGSSQVTHWDGTPFVQSWVDHAGQRHFAE